MISTATTPEEYISKVPKEKRIAFKRLRETIKSNLPKGFKEQMSYGMIGYVVPLKLYPKGYLDKTNIPLPFINIAAQKHFVAIYHMGLYADNQLEKWFKKRYEVKVGKKPDMGRSCLRFRNLESIPFDLIEELVGKISVQEWIDQYESTRVKKRSTGKKA